jgi:Tfp pilus assembly protein PilZ
MTEWGGLNRRRFPRAQYPCLVVLREGQESAESILAHTENFGIGGLCVVVKKQIKMFSQVNIELDLMDMGDNIRCKGKIVWSIRREEDAKEKPLFYDTGIEFVNISDEDVKRLENAVSQISKRKDKTTAHN